MSTPYRSFAFVCFAFSVSVASAQPDLEPVADAESRLAFLNTTIAEFALSRAVGEAFPVSEPLLRYTNPVRNSFSDGTTYLWLEDGRPIGAGTISIRGTGLVWAEFTSISKSPLTCVRSGQPVWTPASGNLIDQPLDKGPVAAPAARLRLIQFRRLAQRFRVIMTDHEFAQENVQTLRLMQEPIHHWPAGDEPALGALFSFCETTDPEALLRLDYDAESGAWSYSFARMTSRPLTCQLDGEEVLSVKGYWGNPRSQNDPYLERQLGDYESMQAAAEATPGE